MNAPQTREAVQHGHAFLLLLDQHREREAVLEAPAAGELDQKFSLLVRHREIRPLPSGQVLRLFLVRREETDEGANDSIDLRTRAGIFAGRPSR